MMKDFLIICIFILSGLLILQNKNNEHKNLDINAPRENVELAEDGE